MADLRVDLRLFADLAETAGETDLKLGVNSESKSPTVEDAIESLVSEYPGLEDKILDGSEVRGHINLVVNGDDADAETRLEDGDEVGVFPPVSGGSGG